MRPLSSADFSEVVRVVAVIIYKNHSVIHYSVQDNGVIRKLAAYVILGINTEGKKEVVTISIGTMKVRNTGFLS